MPLSLLMCASATRPVYNPAVYTFYCTVTVYARTSGALTHHSLSVRMPSSATPLSSSSRGVSQLIHARALPWGMGGAK